MSVLDRTRYRLGVALLGGAKAVQSLQFAPSWMKHAWSDVAFRALAKEGYKANAAVFACVQVWAQAFPEPPLGVRRRTHDGAGDWIHDHPLRQLIARPNPFMGEDEFWAAVITYLVVGGNCYIWKERAANRRPIGLWPLHDGQMSPVPGSNPNEGWIAHYLYDPGDGTRPVEVETSDIIHLRWAFDPLQPTRGISGLIACSRAVDTDNAGLRYVHAYLSNDASPATIVALKEVVGKSQLKRLKQDFKDTFGGDRRGDTMFIEGSEATISRVGAHLQELAVEALHNIPESRIAAAFEVPPGLAGLNVALQRPQGLGSVDDQNVRGFTGRRLVPRWRRVAAQFDAQLLPDFGSQDDLSCEFDLEQVQSLREDQATLIAALSGAVTGGWMTVNRALQRIGDPPVPGGDVFLRGFSVIEVPENGQRPSLPPPPEPAAALPPPDDEPPAPEGEPESESDDEAPPSEGAKAQAIEAEAKARASQAERDRALRVIEDAAARRKALADQATDELEEVLAEARAAVFAAASSGKTTLVGLLPAATLKAIGALIVSQALRAATDGYSHVAEVIGAELPFDPEDAGVRAILERVGERIKGIDDTTRDRVQGLVTLATDERWTPAELAKAIEADKSGAFNRARAEMIARTETAIVHNEASVVGYRASGRVPKVLVFDGDEDEPCASANGSIWTLEEAEKNPIGHPNCVRAFAPHIELGEGRAA